mmetsp:Transcript_1556/g.4504  ORF Transcript_1556/g.4504 Transcript_1556/m.4504 type:complete len:91 (-) Transcript_1556:838-1110(-)
MEVMVQIALKADDFKDIMTPMEWEAFLRQQPKKGQPSFKKWSTLIEWYTLPVWLPVGEDDRRFPGEPYLLQAPQAGPRTSWESSELHTVH